jgi:hypothetical protein
VHVVDQIGAVPLEARIGRHRDLHKQIAGPAPRITGRPRQTEPFAWKWSRLSR